MSRLETGIIEVRCMKLPLCGTLQRAVEAIVLKAEKKQIRLSVDCDEDIVVHHDTKWTEEAVFNLLDNAVKYTGREGNIEISVSVQEIFTKISIRDSGKGIALERQAEIFTRFYRFPEGLPAMLLWVSYLPNPYISAVPSRTLQFPLPLVSLLPNPLHP